jgi:TetR/AcrR family transcriptional regulator
MEKTRSIKNVAAVTDKKVALILDAAQHMFGIYGYSNTTMNSISGKLKISKASLYYYYPDKEHLFKAVLENEMEQFRLRMLQLIGERKHAGSLLKTYVTRRQGFFRNLINLDKLNCELASENKPFQTELIKKFYLAELILVEKIIKKGIDIGEFRPLPKKNTAKLFVDLLCGIKLLSVTRGKTGIPYDETQVSRAAKHLSTIFIKGISTNELYPKNHKIK